MPKIAVEIPAQAATQYSILIASELLNQPNRWLLKSSTAAEIVIITDQTVKKLYGKTLAVSLKKIGCKVLLLAFTPGEQSKNHRTKKQLEEQMLRHGCGRNTLCLALGGGVVGDMAGFIAATYMRGIQLIHLPTSLLSMIDSSVGGKTAINSIYGKNMIGAYWQPKTVIADTRCLQSLPQKQLINGLIEAIKIFLTHDRNSFRYLQKNLTRCFTHDEKILQNVIKRAVSLKALVVAADEKELLGLRMILNFGHTIGHAIEKISGYTMLHGYAVAYGILVEAKISELLGILPPDHYNKIASMLRKLNINPSDLSAYSIKKIIRATKNDKKNQAGKVKYVLLHKIGSAYEKEKIFTHVVNDEIVTQAFQQLMESNHGGK